jgi:glycosyltransferase involved in cell wall biosynthesis
LITDARCLSVVMPCFNEERTIKECISRVLESPYVGEIIVVDDGSTDQTRDVLLSIENSRLRLIFQNPNRGKGAALSMGFNAAAFSYVIVQDADLEYDPNDYKSILAPLLSGKADVVYGSRFKGGDSQRVLYFWHAVANRLLTIASNCFTNLNLTDMETCYKCFKREIIQGIELREQRFGIEPEITSKIANGKWRVYEVGISYDGRTYDEGKKIGFKDAIRAIYCILKYR